MTETRFESEKQKKILEAAGRIFAKKGYHAATVEDVLRFSKVSRATFYSYFSGKEDLFEVLVDLLIREQSAYVLRLADTFSEKSDDLSSLINGVLETIRTEARKSRDALIIFFDVILGSGTRAEKRFKEMQTVSLEHFTELVRKQALIKGHSDRAAKALAVLLIGGLSHAARMIVHGQMDKEQIDLFSQGLSELFSLSPQSDSSTENSNSETR